MTLLYHHHSDSSSYFPKNVIDLSLERPYNSDMNENEEIRLTLRIPKFLHTKLEKRRAITRRSLNQEIVILLERFIESVESAVMEGGQQIASEGQISPPQLSEEDNRL